MSQAPQRQGATGQRGGQGRWRLAIFYAHLMCAGTAYSRVHKSEVLGLVRLHSYTLTRPPRVKTQDILELQKFPRFDLCLAPRFTYVDSRSVPSFVSGFLRSFWCL